MKKSIILGSIALIGSTLSCSQQPKGYSITGTIPAEAQANGEYVYLMVSEGDEFKTIDSALIQDNAFTFARRDQADPMANAMVTYQREYSTPLILEDGDIHVDMAALSATGTTLNDAMAQYMGSLDSVRSALQSRAEALSELSPEEQQKGFETIEQEYDTFITTNAGQLLDKYPNTALGLQGLITLLTSGGINTQEKLNDIKGKLSPTLLTAHPKVKTLLESVEQGIKTQAGASFIDFEGVNDAGEPSKLSDFVGKGHYTLVDFWASWCGPCVREMPNLIKVRDRYTAKGLQIVGVAVWDEMDAHLKAVKEHGITWPQIFNKEEATKLYGISGIPQIMLFAPDGTIVARDLRGEAIAQKLDEILQNTSGKL